MRASRVEAALRWLLVALALAAAAGVLYGGWSLVTAMRRGARQYSVDESLWAESGASPPNLALVQRLLAEGAKPDYMADGNTTCMEVAVGADNAQVARILLDHGAVVDGRVSGHLPLVLAATNGDKGTVAVLLAHHANVNARDYEGKTALARAREALADKDVRRAGGDYAGTAALLKQAGGTE